MQWMFAIEIAKCIEDLRDSKKLDTLASKLRLCLMDILKGQIVKEIHLADAKLKITEGSELNGRQIAWMMRQRFQLDQNEGHFYDQRELMDLRVEGDNVPGYLVAWDNLCLEIDLGANEKEIVFSRQMENAKQLQELFKKYQIDCIRNRESTNHTKSYARELTLTWVLPYA